MVVPALMRLAEKSSDFAGAARSLQSTVFMIALRSRLLGLALTFACACGSNDAIDEGTSEAALTAGQFDDTVGTQGRVDVAEKFLGEDGQKLLFFGVDAQGPYVARRTRQLVLDVSYGTGGKAAIDLSAHANGSLADAALLPDGRVIAVGGKDAGGVEPVLNGVTVTKRAMLVAAVAADGKRQKVTSYARLSTGPYPSTDDVYRAYTLEGTAVTALADGRIAVGASVGLYDSNNSLARVYAYSFSDLDAQFEAQMWEGRREAIYTSTRKIGPARVTSLKETKPGTLLLGTTGYFGKIGDELARSAIGNYTSVVPVAGAQAVATTVHAVADSPSRTVVGPFPNGRVVLAGYNRNACTATIALAFLEPDLTSDASFADGAPPRPDLHCASGGEFPGTVAAVLPVGQRIFAVTARGAESTVWALDANGNVDAAFGNGGKVTTPGIASAVFESGGFLYLQLWDSYVFVGGGAGSGGHWRRMKL